MVAPTSASTGFVRIEDHPMSVAPSTQTVEADKSRWLRRDSADEPPARLLLSRRRIVVTALALVEEHGLEALTMRRVAASEPAQMR